MAVVDRGMVAGADPAVAVDTGAAVAARVPHLTTESNKAGVYILHHTLYYPF